MVVKLIEFGIKIKVCDLIKDFLECNHFFKWRETTIDSGTTIMSDTIENVIKYRSLLADIWYEYLVIYKNEILPNILTLTFVLKVKQLI